MVYRMPRGVPTRISALLLVFLATLFVAEFAEAKLIRGLGKPKSKVHQKRHLKGKKSQGSSDSPWRDDHQDSARTRTERMVVNCDPSMGQENCLKLLESNGENIKIVHKLPGIHAFAIEVDPSTRDDLTRMGVDLSVDHIREPLHIQGSMKKDHDRALQIAASQTIPYGVDLINANKVWEEYRVQGEGVKICIMDTGVYADHPDFATTNLSGYEGPEAMTPWYEDTRGHGTHITGIIAASNIKQGGIIGVAPAAEIYVMRVFKDNGRFYGSDVVAAAEACRDAGANIIQMSLGGDKFDQAEHDIFEELYNTGVLAVASAGNSGGPELVYPASYDKVISVASCDKNKALSDFSSFNSFVDVAAPGKCFG